MSDTLFNCERVVSTGSDSDGSIPLHSTNQTTRVIHHRNASVDDPVAIAPGTDLLAQLDGTL